MSYLGKLQRCHISFYAEGQEGQGRDGQRRREKDYIAGHHTNVIMLHNQSRNLTNPRELFFIITTCKVEIVSFYLQTDFWSHC